VWFQRQKTLNHQEMDMTIRKKITALTLGGTLFLGMAGAALAAQAVATGSVNVRSGPSTQYQRVDTLQRGQVVDVNGCRGGWCYVEKRGADGWVSANYLRQVSSQQSVKPSINFSFSFGNVPQAPRPPRPPRPDHGGWNGGHGWNGGNWNHGGWNGNGPRDRDWND
jgi:uncharacterized protein YraI